MHKRLGKKEYGQVYSDQLTSETVVAILTQQASAKLEAIDPDLPPATREAMAARIRRDYRDKVDVQLQQMKARAEQVEAQRQFYEQGALLRRAGVTAPAQVTLVVQRASDAGLAQLARDAAADGDRELGGAVALELAARNLSVEVQHEVSEALSHIDFPELTDLDRLFQPTRDKWIAAELAALEVAPTGGSTALRKMELGRMLGQPVLGGHHAA